MKNTLFIALLAILALPSSFSAKAAELGALEGDDLTTVTRALGHFVYAKTFHCEPTHRNNYKTILGGYGYVGDAVRVSKDFLKVEIKLDGKNYFIQGVESDASDSDMVNFLVFRNARPVAEYKNVFAGDVDVLQALAAVTQTRINEVTDLKLSRQCR